MVAIPRDVPRTGTDAGGTILDQQPLRRAAIAGYALTALAVVVGYWLTRGRELFDAESGFGYWLGIVGASLMATLLLYPLRKRVRFMHSLGATTRMPQIGTRVLDPVGTDVVDSWIRSIAACP